MTLRWTLVRMTPVVASLLLHVVAYGAIAMVPKYTAVPERVFIADLVEPDPAPPVPVVAPARPKAPDRRPVTLPKPIETPMPAMTPPTPEPRLETPAPPPPPAAVAQETPAPEPARAPSVATAPRATVPMDAPPAPTGGEGLPVAQPQGPVVQAPPAPPPAPVPSSAPAPSVAALPPDGVTQTAVPRGGYQVRPSYPANARRLGIQGTTLLSVFVAVDGRVGDVVVKQSAGHPDLDQAAADAVRRWRFEPARRGSDAVAMWVLLPVEFRLR
jgi:periplasmic protein TonB